MNISSVRPGAINSWADRFFHSGYYVAAVTAVGLLGFALKAEIAAIYVIGILTAVSWILVKDITPSFIAMAVIAMTPLARYGQAGYFTPLYYIPIVLAPAFIARFFIFPVKIKTGAFFVPTLAVAVAITLGGIFFLSPKAYFSMPGLYYVFGLGFLMVIVNLILESYGEEGARCAPFLTKMMSGIGIMGIGMIAIFYYRYFPLIGSNFAAFSKNFQLGNNLTNNLLLSMPFSFYLSLKGKRKVLHLILGILQYFAMVLSLSRGGILFGTFSFVVCSSTVIALSGKRKRLYYFLIIGLSVALAAFLAYKLLTPVAEDILLGTRVNPDEARVKMYRLAWDYFKKYPLFGTGLQHNPNKYYFPQSMCIYWYHSTLFQVLASLGIVGVAAYALQSFYRLKTLSKKTLFNLFVFFSILGFWGYSMVNVGYFVPFPFVAMTLQMMIIAERNNRFVKLSPIKR